MNLLASTRKLFVCSALLLLAPVFAKECFWAIELRCSSRHRCRCSGAAIPKAQVELTSEATQITRTTVSNGSGEYSFSAVDPGTYTVTAVTDGFSKLVHRGVIVDSGNTIPVDMALQVGSAAGQTIEVTASEPLVTNGTSYNGQLIDSQKLQNLPNPGRNPFLFSKLDNNVTAVGDPRFVRFQDQSGSSTISIAGAPMSSNNYSIDGVPITDFSNRAVIIPSIEAVDEVKIQANTYDAEIGRTSGGMFNTTLHSGATALHGVLQGETRQTNWGANLFFYNRTPYKDPVTGVVQPTTPRPPAEFYSYVGSLSGPIPLPHFLGGKDKTFFSITEEGYRQRSPITTNAFVVPTARQLTGDFSEIGTPDATLKVCNKGSDTVDAICIKTSGLDRGSLLCRERYSRRKHQPDWTGAVKRLSQSEHGRRYLRQPKLQWWRHAGRPRR